MKASVAWRSCAGGRCDAAGCRSARARKSRTMKASVALGTAAGGGEERGLTDETVRQARGRGKDSPGEHRGGDGTSNGGLGLWVQRDAFLFGIE